jgi:hypothetical protein
MRRFFQTLLAVVVMEGAFLAGGVWQPTSALAESEETWDCLGLDIRVDSDTDDQATAYVDVTNLGSDQSEVKVKFKDKDGDRTDVDEEFELDAGQTRQSSTNLDGIRRAIVTTSTDGHYVTAWVVYFRKPEIVGARQTPCTRR